MGNGWIQFWHERQRKSGSCLLLLWLAGWLCKMALILAKICPKTTLELTGQLFSQKKPQTEGTLFSDLRKVLCLSSPFMKGQSREQCMACIRPSPAAALGTSRAQFLLLHSAVVVALKHIFSSIRYCSCFIRVKIEPWNVIIDLCVRYHYEQENKLFTASACIGLTKIVASVSFFTIILSEIIRSFSGPKKEIIILVEKNQLQSVLEIWGEKVKKKELYKRKKHFSLFT